ncbi:MAG: hypothetical protein ACE5R6_04065 [Candidatus Heimdallarchaeota archaeon]
MGVTQNLIDKLLSPFKLLKRETTDKLVLVIEISFIFLLSFSFVYLLDLVLKTTEIDGFYFSLANKYIGTPRWYYTYKRIFRAAFLFTGLLFGVSLLFGLWMRWTRDRWSWSDFGFKKEYPTHAIYQGLFLGFLSAGLLIVILFPIEVMTYGSSTAIRDLGFQGLNPEEMEAEILWQTLYLFVWSLSAELYFFAYMSTSLESKVGKSQARWMSSALLVLYLFLFNYLAFPKTAGTNFLDPIRENWTSFSQNSTEIIFRGGWLLWLFIVFILFLHAFLVTKNILVPIIAHITVNIILLAIAIINAGTTSSMALIPFLVVWILIIGWFILDARSKKLLRDAFVGRTEEIVPAKTEPPEIPSISTNPLTSIILFLLLVVLAFVAPFTIVLYLSGVVEPATVASICALDFLLCFTLGLVVLTYSPSKVYDVLLVSEGGLPIAARREIFEADESMISGFLSALESFSQEIDAFEKSAFQTIRKARYSIVFDDGVLGTKIVTVLDHDRSPMREQIRSKLHEFEKQYRSQLEHWTGKQFDEARQFVEDISKLDERFEISPETKWLAFLSYFFLSLIFLVIFLITQL